MATLFWFSYIIGCMRYFTYLFLVLILKGFMACTDDTEPVLPAAPADRPTDSYSIIQDTILDVPIIVLGNPREQLMTHFITEKNGVSLEFIANNADRRRILTDQLGNAYDIHGYVVDGPWEGQRLDQLSAGMGYWFAIVALSRGVELYREGIGAVPPKMPKAPGWLISTNTVTRGAGFDAIRAIDDPVIKDFVIRATHPDDPFLLEPDDRVIIVSLDGETRLYPHRVLDWHEIVNDVLRDHRISLSYCPLTATARVWDLGTTAAEADRFGVSGLVYNSNILAFDRATESLWTQLDGRCVYGDRAGELMTEVPYLETTWGTWTQFQLEPSFLVGSASLIQSYDFYPYGDYDENDIITYPVEHQDDRLHKKTLVYAVHYDDVTVAYQYEDFDQ